MLGEATQTRLSGYRVLDKLVRLVGLAFFVCNLGLTLRAYTSGARSTPLEGGPELAWGKEEVESVGIFLSDELCLERGFRMFREVWIGDSENDEVRCAGREGGHPDPLTEAAQVALNDPVKTSRYLRGIDLQSS